MKLLLLLLLCFSQPLLAKELTCQISGDVVPDAKYPNPTNIYTQMKNDGYPMMAFGFLVKESKALNNKKQVRDYCSSLPDKTLQVILSGNYPNGHFHVGERLTLTHTYQDENVWPYWPMRYYNTSQ